MANKLDCLLSSRAPLNGQLWHCFHRDKIYSDESPTGTNIMDLSGNSINKAVAPDPFTDYIKFNFIESIHFVRE
jgi:hypothetical protein